MERQGQRDMVFCHQCENEWYRDEGGLICPMCQSEFTEIIEADHDPRNNHAHSQDANDSVPDLHDHNPWAAPDPDEGDVDRVQWRSTGPNSMSFTGTFVRTLSPPGDRARPGAHQPHQQPPANSMADLLGNFSSMFQNIMGNRPGQEGAQQTQGAQGQRAATPDPRAGTSEPHQHLHDHPAGPRIEIRTGGGPRYTYTTTARLYDPNNPHRNMASQGDDLHAVLGQLFMGFPPLGATPRVDPFQQPGAHPPGVPPNNALAALFSAFFNPAAAAHGDAVYTQEALDRVISQLMEQNQSGNAPGPASAEAIQKIPKVKVDQSMLGDNGRAECSICMDEVQLGEEVAKLYCGHWFHPTCVEAWLIEHDTCPHCRKGIMNAKENVSGSSGNNNNPGPGSGSGPGPGSPGGPSGMPPSWDSNDGGGTGGWGSGGGAGISGGSGAGTFADPYVVNDPGNTQSRPTGMSRHVSHASEGSQGGIRNSVRHFFGRGER